MHFSYRVPMAFRLVGEAKQGLHTTIASGASRLWEFCASAAFQCVGNSPRFSAQRGTACTTSGCDPVTNQVFYK